MKQQANLIRAGQVIEHEGRRWTVLKQQIITPGKGGAFIQVEMRDLKSGNKTNERWRTADTVERLTTEEKEYTYSYSDGTNLVLMDPDTYEEAHVPADLMGDSASIPVNPFVPRPGYEPPPPEWKSRDYLKDVLSKYDPHRNREA